jgi:general secretion pathway protein I
MPAPARRCEGGFTLIEVLVALAILALTLGGGLRALGQLTQSATRLPQAVLAQACMDNALAMLRWSGKRPVPGVQQSTCVQGSRTFVVALDVLPTPNPWLMRIEGSVLDGDGHAVVQVVALVGGEG